MSSQPASLFLYFLLIFVTCGQGMHLFMDTTPRGVYCGHLYCWTDKTVTNNNIQTVFGIAVYDVNKYSMSVKIASLSVFGPDICLRESEVTSIIATGNVSKYHAEMILAFRDTSYCVNGSFVCELEFANMNGDPDVIQQTVSSESSGSCYEILKELQTDSKNHEMERELAQSRKEILALNMEVFRLQEIVNKSIHVTQGNCLKGAPYNNSREIFLLWGKEEALCDTETDGGGWIVIQMDTSNDWADTTFFAKETLEIGYRDGLIIALDVRRTQGDVDFYRDWLGYKDGFGTPETDFWIGNDIIHNLTSQGYTELRVDLEYQGRQYFAQYSDFYVAGETSFYRLSVSGYSGTAGDSLAYHDGINFTIFDKDNDVDSDNCASSWYQAWWYASCHSSNLKELWREEDHSGDGWDGVVYPGSVSVSEMKIRHV